MGVIYKLRSEIKEYILEEKKNKPILSCRGLEALVQKRFNLKVSKSSINSLMKEAGLSMPAGRTRKKRRRKPQIKQLIEAPAETAVEKVAEEISVEKIAPEPVKPPVEAPIEKPSEMPPAPVEIEEALPSEMPCTGAILLKVADYLIGGSVQMVEAIKNRLNLPDKDLLTKTEGLIYRSLFDIAKEDELKTFWALLNKKITPETLMQYLNELQEVRELPLDIFEVISQLFKEVRCVKVTLSEGTIFYLDGQLHTVWSTPQIPYAFSTALYNIRSYIKKYFYSDSTCMLFMVPGYDAPTKEFFDFILSLEAKEKSISKLSLYDHKFEEIEAIPLSQTKKRPFVFGLWPWQFGQFRSVKLLGEFKPCPFECLKKELYLANIELELLQPTTSKRVTLRGFALKTNLNEKTRLVILSNLSFDEFNRENLAELYLSHWPNLEEGFQDFSRKIELFTYTASSFHSFFSPESFNLHREALPDLSTLFNSCLKVLDLYVRRYILPSGYEELDFSTVKERFYHLKAQLKQEKNYSFLTFQPPQGFPFLKDLEYACRRINEREIILADGKRLCCS